jgi:sorbitol/mannitol transport system permease protein
MSRKTRDGVFIIPAIVIVAVMTQVPFLLTIIYSTLRWNLARPDLAVKFHGFENYMHFFRMPYFPELPEFYHIVWQTIVMTGGALILCTILGFLLAVLFDHRVPGINIARTLVLGPFFVMSTASGVIWKTTIFNTTFGWYGVLAKSLGMQPIDLLSNFPLGVIILLFTWRWMPFFVLIMLAGLQSISEDLIDSTKIDGATWFQATFFVKLPVISKHVTVAVMLGLIFIVKEFGLILVTTAGGPGTSSYNLPFAVYMQVFNASNVGRAGALATMTVILSLLAVNAVYRLLKKQAAIYD